MHTEFKHLGLYIKTGHLDRFQTFSVYLYVDGHQIKGIKEPRKTLLHFYRIDTSGLLSKIQAVQGMQKYRQFPQAFINAIVKTSRRPVTHILHPDNERYISHQMKRETIAFRAHTKTLPKNVAHSHGNHSGKNYVELTDIEQIRHHIQQFLLKDFMSTSFATNSELETRLFNAISRELNPYLLPSPIPLALDIFPSIGL